MNILNKYYYKLSKLTINNKRYENPFGLFIANQIKQGTYILNIQNHI